MKFGYENINFHKIQICHKEGNIASQKVIEKCGFQYEGALRDFFYCDGKYLDRLYYSLLQEEWRCENGYLANMHLEENTY